FDARSYGYGKLSDLVAATSLFEIERRSAGEGRPKAIHVRNRSQPARR
ncbi:MAG: OST-HTH/LOTUS domain-containing protein, partial [Rhodanobacteraceae bacterium]